MRVGCVVHMKLHQVYCCLDVELCMGVVLYALMAQIGQAGEERTLLQNTANAMADFGMCKFMTSGASVCDGRWLCRDQ